MVRCSRGWQTLLAALVLAGVASLPRAAGSQLGVPALLDPDAAPRAVTALGRIEPRDGLIRVAGPSRPSVVIRELRVQEGDQVEAGQVLAVLDTLALHEAEVARIRAELSNARAQRARHTELRSNDVVPVSRWEEWDTRVRVAEAELRRALADVEMDRVRAPIEGQVIEIHAYPGERVDERGVLELGRTQEMFAIAEVYETDVLRVSEGQRATIESPALPEPLSGTVERIGLKVGKLDLTPEDPAARVDARVVEVEVRLDDGARARGLTNLQVEIRIEP